MVHCSLKIAPKTKMTMEEQPFEDVSISYSLKMVLFHCHVSFLEGTTPIELTWCIDLPGRNLGDAFANCGAEGSNISD